MLDDINSLHNKEILHRNIKLDNILISSNPPNKDTPFTVKLGTLGITSRFQPS